MEIAEVALRTILSYVVLLILTRIMGKKQISELTFFDYVTGISIGTIAGSVSATLSMPLLPALYALVFWALLALVTGVVVRSSIPARKLIESEPVMVIRDGQVLEETLLKSKYSVNNLLMQLREQQVFDPSEVSVGIIETDGKLSIKKKEKERTTAAEPLSPVFKNKELIIDGQVQFGNLREAGLAPDWLSAELRKKNISDPSKVALATLTPKGTLYIDKTEDVLPKTTL